MFRYALALFKYKENDILKIHDSVEIHQYLRFFTKTITDSRYRLIYTPACYGCCIVIGPLSLLVVVI